MSRVLFIGRVHLSELAFARVQEAAMLELFVVEGNDDDGHDDDECVLRAVSARELFADSDGEYRAWSRNRYDAATQTWLFSCSLHDDDWDNANNAFAKTLPALKDCDGDDCIFAFREWNRTIDHAWRLERSACVPRDVKWQLPDELARQLLEARIEAAEPMIRAELLKRESQV